MIDRKDKYTEWEREILDFVNSDPVNPPMYLTEKLKNTVSQDMNVVIWRIFSKLAGIQVGYATFTLFFCPQFEIGFTKHDLLAHLVQHSEGVGFMIVCGMIFLGGGAVIASFFFNQVEMKAIEKSVFIYFPTASFLAVMLFYSLGADIDWTLALPWFSGATLGSLIGFKIVKHLRYRLATP
ncbi:MAG: hypothetical protein OEM02_13120 [Desulfobulbaceae bacterium]|nr:hypothetical protein [Desulfobulbaceae bacterium]